VAVAGDDLRRCVLGADAEPLHDRCLDRRGKRGVGPDGAGELAEARACEGALEPFDVAGGFEGEAGEAQPEARRLGVDPVCAPDADGVAVLDRPLDQRVSVGDCSGNDDLAGGGDLGRQRRVEHVGGGQSVMDPAPFRPDRRGDDVDERGDVVVRRPLALLDRLDAEARPLPAGDRVGRRDDAGVGEGLGDGQLDLQPALHLPPLGPDGAYLLAGIARDQRPMIRAA
jgi:hypothetical protein